MRKLLQGIIQFRREKLAEYREKFARLALGQRPDTLFIACSDSRVVPNLFASTDPGDLFVVRNVGNLIPPYAAAAGQAHAEAAAIEFSLKNFPINDIVVCGHSECGAMQALCCGVDATQEPLLRSWLGYGLSSVEAWKSGTGGVTTPVELAPHNALSQVNVLRQLSHLATYPFIAERVAKGTLHLHGWWFDLHGADVYAFDPQAEKFILIDHT